MSDTPDRPSDLSRIFDEFLVRRQQGESPILDEYCQRFPDLADQLRLHVGLYDALGEAGSEIGLRSSAKDSCDPVAAVLDRSVRRFRQLCNTILHRGYPQMTHPPLNLQTDEILNALVGRLEKALREASPTNARHFFALAGQHIRWELNGLARRLDEQPSAFELREELVPAPNSDSHLTPSARRIFDVIDRLPEAEREAFDLVRIQGLSSAEAAQILGVSGTTVNRWLHRSLQVLAEALGDLRPDEDICDSN